MTKKKDPKDLLPHGRPTPYNKSMDDMVYKLSLLGLTDVEMCNIIGVTERTFNNWKQKYPSFFQSIIKGKDIADAEIAASLYQRAKGYSHPDVDIKVVDGRIVKTELIKHYPPDTAAALIWLKNRQKSKWRDKVEHGITDLEGNDVVIFKLPDNNR